MITDYDVAKKFLSVRTNAEQRGLDFDLSLRDVRRLLSRKTCYYTGKRMTTARGEPEEATRPDKLTFDRVDNKLGYVKGNVVACCHAANQLKQMIFEQEGGKYRLSPKELLLFGQAMVEGR